MTLPACAYRYATDSPAKFYCRHERVFAPANVVPAKVCELCQWREAPCLFPRPVPAGMVAAPLPEIPPGGPGTELHRLLLSLGVHPTATCGCASRIAQMDAWRVEGCKANRATIVGWVREGYAASGGWLAAAARSAAIVLTLGLAGDPIGWLVDEAIRRAK